jgi:integrase
LVYPKSDEKYPFMTYEEIMPVVSRTTDEEEISKLWESLFLMKEEIGEVLDDVDANARCSYIYPMVVLAAHTGARRSEILRSQREDFDFPSGVVTFREKKRSKVNAITFRRVEMSDLVEDVMRTWFSSAEAGPTFTISLRMSKRWRDTPVSVDAAHYQLQAALSDTRWCVIRGFHIFRHSFASNLAAAGVDQRIIDEFMGHRTDSMRRRYRHLFPHVRKQAIASVFS